MSLNKKYICHFVVRLGEIFGLTFMCWLNGLKSQRKTTEPPIKFLKFRNIYLPDLVTGIRN